MIQSVIFLLMALCFINICEAQEVYNDCNNALEVCPNNTYNLNNISANVTFCPDCEDDFNYCFATDNSIWMTFTTNATGGDVQVDFSNLIFNNNPGQDNELQATIIEAIAPCNAGTYTQVGSCVFDATTNFSLNAVGLQANTVYYIVVDGDNNGVGVTSPAECTFDLAVSGTGIDRPVPNSIVSTTTPSSCLNEVVTYTATLTDCPDSSDYFWYVNDVLVATTSAENFQTSSLNDGDVVSVKNACYLQCIDTVEAIAAPHSVFVINVDAGLDITIQEGESIQLFGTTSAPVYYWSPSFLVSNVNDLNPIANPDVTTTFTLTAEENGCVLSDQVTIFISSELVIPNTFSPNNDENNDTWVINGIEAYPDNSVKIFDRWGQQIFAATAYSQSKAWDGSIKKGKASEGVYFYVIDLRDDSEVRTGSLTLIR